MDRSDLKTSGLFSVFFRPFSVIISEKGRNNTENRPEKRRKLFSGKKAESFMFRCLDFPLRAQVPNPKYQSKILVVVLCPRDGCRWWVWQGLFQQDARGGIPAVFPSSRNLLLKVFFWSASPDLFSCFQATVRLYKQSKLSRYTRCGFFSKGWL